MLAGASIEKASLTQCIRLGWLFLLKMLDWTGIKSLGK